MAHNLFISYDLYMPGQGYDRIIDLIKQLGPWAKVQKSLWYVSSNRSAEEAAKFLRTAIDNNDALIVVDASNNNAYWYSSDQAVTKQMVDHWYK